ncbi:hypothetical protein THAOC_25844 [Thalassiosira oceanica]|uniref:Uncharacterized protein n=1 Tax=Thalassiosira oceanica TaxID=159749 RepID=K0S6M1_THAOC|nr:hypothetical protein THAOC_25844 [Thalassiosira oceanica]|eukprot:EJK54522.1 hypothetical protein THAOC_25844 [Thalassiosira oceanica]
MAIRYPSRGALCGLSRPERSSGSIPRALSLGEPGVEAAGGDADTVLRLVLDRWPDQAPPTQSEGGEGVGGAVDATRAASEGLRVSTNRIVPPDADTATKPPISTATKTHTALMLTHCRQGSRAALRPNVASYPCLDSINSIGRLGPSASGWKDQPHSPPCKLFLVPSIPSGAVPSIPSGAFGPSASGLTTDQKPPIERPLCDTACPRVSLCNTMIVNRLVVYDKISAESSQSSDSSSIVEFYTYAADNHEATSCICHPGLSLGQLERVR